MDGVTIVGVLSWALIGFFVVGSAVNVWAPESIREDYARWGYPSGFHYVTAILELAVALLLVFPETRLPAAFLGMAVMAAAAGTTLLNHEYGRSIAPSVVLALTATLGWILSWR